MNGLEISTIGSATNLGYDYVHLGNSSKTLEDIANGDHPYYEKLLRAELPMIIISADTLSRSDGDAIMNLINKLASKTNIIN